MPTFKSNILTVIFCLTPLAACVFPRASILCMAIVTLALLPQLKPTLRSLRDTIPGQPVLVAFLALCAYLLANSFWSLDSGTALAKVAGVLAYGLLAIYCVNALMTLAPGQLTRAASAMTAGWIIGTFLVLCALYLHSQQIMLVFLSDMNDRFGTGFSVDNKGFLDKNAAVVALLLFPALLCLGNLVSERRRIWQMVMFAVAFIVPFSSSHESSQVGLIAATLVWLLARQSPGLVRKMLIAAWCLAFVAIIPFSLMTYRASLHKAEWLPVSAQARIILWNYTAEQVSNAPILGVGIRSTRILHKQRKEEIVKPEGHVYPVATGRHAHSLFLQSWYELGLVGVLFVMAFGGVLLWNTRHLPRFSQPYVLATFTVFLGIAAFAWGMFQTWLMALYALTAIFLFLGIAAKERMSPDAASGGS